MRLKKSYRRRAIEKRQKRVRNIRLRMYILLGGVILFLLCLFLLNKGEKAKEEAETLISETANGEINEAIAGERQEILLVNKDNPLPEDYEVDLVMLSDAVNCAAKEAYEPLCEMLESGRKEGLCLVVCSSYRDVARQTELFEEDVEELIQRGYSYEDAYDEAAKETMLPGSSEHSTGLAFDIVSLDYQMLDEGQENTEENQWLQEHCAEYGFILRYPKGKEDITSINYESWHFRYVGKEAAKYITEKGITLEEYLGEY